MPSVAIARLESALQARKLDLTLARPAEPARPRGLPSGLAPLDAALGGGWPRGELSEIAGPRSSGRTGVLLAALASATAGGGVAGLIDVLDRFDPVTAAAAGVALDRVLWVRGPSLTAEIARPALVDRVVRQAVRAFDLIVRAGGFALAAFDAADVPPRALQGLPAATWMRVARGLGGRDTVALIVAGAPAGRSARGVSVRLEASGRWAGTSAASRRLAGLSVRARVVQARAAAGGDPAWAMPVPALE